MKLLILTSEMDKLTEIMAQAACSPKLTWALQPSLSLARSWLTIDLYLWLRIVSKRLRGSTELKVRGRGLLLLCIDPDPSHSSKVSPRSLPAHVSI